MVAHLGETYIEKSHWNTRAWTFQERLLSRRCLIFTEERIYFQCHETAISEDVISEGKDAAWSLDLLNAPLQQMQEVEKRPLRVYSTCVSMYTDRDLGRSKDNVAAFTGIGNTIGASLGGKLIYCLPDTHFDWTLLWEPRDAPKRRRPVECPNEFPSWSWCGWEDSVMEYKKSTVSGCLDNLHEWLREHTWIVWYIRNGHGTLRLLWNGSRETKPKGRMEYRWAGYSMPTASRPQDTQDADEKQKVDEYGRLERFPDNERSKFNLMLPEYPYSVSVADDRTRRDDQLPDLPYLQFWTLSAFFRIELGTSHPSETPLPASGRDLGRVGLSDCRGDWCGTIVLDRNWLEKQDPKRSHEFIAISDAKSFSTEEYDGWTYYISKEREQSEWDLYFVILIEKEGDISRRIGLGKVFKHAFQNSFECGQAWKEFILG